MWGKDHSSEMGWSHPHLFQLQSFQSGGIEAGTGSSSSIPFCPSLMIKPIKPHNVGLCENTYPMVHSIPKGFSSFCSFRIAILVCSPFLSKVKPSEKLKNSTCLGFHADFHTSVDIHELPMWITCPLRGGAPPRLARRGCGRPDSREELLETQRRWDGYGSS